MNNFYHFGTYHQHPTVSVKWDKYAAYCMILLQYAEVGWYEVLPVQNSGTGLILGLHPANERRRYKITPSLIGFMVQTQPQPCRYAKWSVRQLIEYHRVGSRCCLHVAPSFLFQSWPITDLLTQLLLISTDAKSRADSRFAPSQWETALLCNDVSHWLGTSLESPLQTCPI